MRPYVQSYDEPRGLFVKFVFNQLFQICTTMKIIHRNSIGIQQYECVHRFIMKDTRVCWLGFEQQSDKEMESERKNEKNGHRVALMIINPVQAAKNSETRICVSSLNSAKSAWSNALITF